jgi:hypothetical protein
MTGHPEVKLFPGQLDQKRSTPISGEGKMSIGWNGDYTSAWILRMALARPKLLCRYRLYRQTDALLRLI